MAENVSIVIDALERAKGVIEKTVRDLGGIRKAGDEANRGLRNARDGMRQTEGAAQSLGNTLRNTAKNLLAAFTLAKLAQITKDALEATDELAALAEAVGMTADSLYRLQRVAGDVNIRAEQFTSSVNLLNRALVEAQDETTKKAQMFEAMGISTVTAEGRLRSTKDVLLEVAEAFRSYADGPEKAALAQELFGRSGYRMVAFLNLGSDEIRRQMEEARGLSEEQIRAAEVFSTTMGQIRQLVMELGLAIGQAVVPVLADMVTWVDRNTRSNESWRQSLQVVGDMARGLAVIFTAVGGAIADTVDRIATMARVAGVLSNTPLFRASMGLSGLFLPKAGVSDRQGLGEAFRELAEMQDRSTKRYQDMAKAAGNLLDFTRQTAQEEKRAADQAKTRPAGTKVAPLNVDQIKVARTELAKLEASRAEAEAAYQSSLLETQQLVQTGAISQAQAFERDRAASLALAENLHTINQELRELAERNPRAPELRSNLQRGLIQEQELRVRGGVPGVNDWSAQMRITMQEMRDEFALTAQKVAQTFRGTIRGAIDSVSDGVTGLVMGTKSWGQALVEIRNNIVGSVINAITKMFAEWVVGRALAGAASIAWSAKEGAADVAAKTPGALLSSISSFGVAAAVGVAALLAAMAAFGAFAEGGYTGPGAKHQPAGIVHAGEYVIPADVVGQLGAGYFEEYRQGRIPERGRAIHSAPANRPGHFAAGGFAATPTGGSRTDVAVAFVNSRQDLREWMAREGYRIVADEAAKRSNTFKA